MATMTAAMEASCQSVSTICMHTSHKLSTRQLRTHIVGHLQTSSGAWCLRAMPPLQQRRCALVRAFNGSDGSGKSVGNGGGFRGGLDPSLEVAVPSDQRPVNELAALRKGTLYSWVRDAHSLSCTFINMYSDVFWISEHYFQSISRQIDFHCSPE